MEIFETEYDIGQDNFSGAVSMELDIHEVVLSVSAVGIMHFTLLTLAFRNDAEPLLVSLRDFLTGNLDRFFLLSGNIFVLVCFGLILSPLGRARLGGPDATPDFGHIGCVLLLSQVSQSANSEAGGRQGSRRAFASRLGGPSR